VAEYVERLIDPLLDELMADLPAVLIVGPRACGKTTTGRRHSAGRLRLDRPAEAAAVRIDPDAMLAEGPFPLLVDEWQAVPEVLGAVKRSVDEGAEPGQFLLTGSSQADLAVEGWPATGRVVRVVMHGLAEREAEGQVRRPPLIDRLVTSGLDGVADPADAPDIRGYVARALRGSFPETVLMGSDRARRRWLASYLDQVVSRDAGMVGVARDPVRLRRYLRALAASAGGIPTVATLIDAAAIDRRTAIAYDTLLQHLFLTEQLPAWSASRLSRLVHLPKRYLVDPAFLGPLLGVDARAVLRDNDLLGRVLDNFVVSQLRADCLVSDLAPQLFHIRDANGRREVDILVELADGRVIGIEVKATAAPVPEDARHLRWLQGILGDKFAAGAVMHTGPRRFRLGEALYALPICTFWT
jgi:predicted AAA+ superfamily ATPase